MNVADQFWRDGVVVLENLFSEAELAPISDEVDRVIRREVAYVPDADLVYEPGTTRLRNAFRLHLYEPQFLEFARKPQLAAVVRSILGEPVRLYGSQVFAKPARVGTAVPRHQDMPYWPFAPDDMLSAWIALDDSTEENGCVRFALGSHKLGRLPHAPSGVMGNSLGLVAGAETLPEFAAIVRRGSCVLHHSLTVHHSEANQSEMARRGLVYVYMGREVKLVEPERMKGPALFLDV
jgi:phytanoyl-CoA hydroxylase